LVLLVGAFLTKNSEAVQGLQIKTLTSKDPTHIAIEGDGHIVKAAAIEGGGHIVNPAATHANIGHVAMTIERDAAFSEEENGNELEGSEKKLAHGLTWGRRRRHRPARRRSWGRRRRAKRGNKLAKLLKQWKKALAKAKKKYAKEQRQLAKAKKKVAKAKKALGRAGKGRPEFDVSKSSR